MKPQHAKGISQQIQTYREDYSDHGETGQQLICNDQVAPTEEAEYIEYLNESKIELPNPELEEHVSICEMDDEAVKQQLDLIQPIQVKCEEE